MRSDMHTSSGFTLVELLVASVFLAFGALAVVSLHIAANKAQGQASTEQIAQQIALDRIDRIKADGFSALSNGATSTKPSELPGSTMVVSVSSYPNAFSTHLKNVSVTVSWSSDAKGRNGASPRAGGAVVFNTLIVDELGEQL
ncbi:MAG: hypothetical protein IT209_08505 [Armatimonadetes bacterium]|nr:hypothetical protein [Armatimonadota bacterium]